MKTILFSIIFLTLNGLIQAQEKLDFDISKSCSFYGKEITGNIYSFDSTEEAIEIIDKIVSKVGLERNFRIMSGNVPNAVAVIKPTSEGHERFIIYSQSFISNLKESSKSYWSSIGVLAHEMAHHFNGHTLLVGGSRPSIELEADKFAGFVLAKMDANISQAQSMFNNDLMYQEHENETHPATSARLEAIAVGWENGRDKQKRKIDISNTDERENSKTNNSTEDLCDLAVKILDGKVNKNFEGSLKVLEDALNLSNCYSRSHELIESELAFWYFNGQNGASRDDNIAYSWAKKAANKGDRRGMFFIGALSLTPNDKWQSRGERIISYNKKRGITYLTKSSDLGFGPAEQFLIDLGEY
ncbi:MAG: hypothetical protein ACSHWW_14090 [Nonlabens sp.]|uniref:hypothetical protein n=1 Tax=Nonlabens sp. TaxID=1888209 RepID=UPI003EF1243C